MYMYEGCSEIIETTQISLLLKGEFLMEIGRNINKTSPYYQGE